MELLERRQAIIEERLTEVIDGIEPDRLRREVGHTALSDGKRVRPMVTILACEAVGGDVSDAIDYAVGIELVHTASLVIDDIIDRSDLRRGTTSAWSEFGYGPAIVSSDGLLGEAFALFSANPKAMQVVSEAMVELGIGEATELTTKPDDEDEYMTLARRKTGALFRAAAELGAIAAASDPFTVEALGEYAERVGIAFQIRDDVLDEVAAPAELGKPTGHDAALERPSLIQVTDLSKTAANERARQEADQAIAALETVDIADGDARDYLLELAEFVVERDR